MDEATRNYLDGIRQDIKEVEIRLSNRIDGVEKKLESRMKRIEENMVTKKDLDNLFHSIVQFFETHGIDLMKR